MKDGQIVDESELIKNASIDFMNAIGDCQIYAKNLMEATSKLASLSDLTNDQRRNAKAARDYAMQCVGRLFLIK